jgi:adenylate cyclase
VAVAWIASWSTIRTPPAKAAADSTLVRAIAVLPFVNQSRQASHEPFVDGVHEALITELSKVGALRVIARTSSMRYRNTDKTLTEIAGELNVDSIIEGDVLRDAERVRVSIRLADPRSQTNRWSEQYDRDLKDVIALQSEIARAIARRIRVAVSDSEQTRLAVERPANVAAYEAYVRGRHHARKLTKRDMEDAIAWFERAIELDRAYAEAYSGLADACLRHELFESRTPAADAIRNKMRIAVRSALRLDDTIADAHWLLGVVHGIDHDWPAAEREFLRAIELDPSNSEARRRYAYYLTSVGRADAGAAQITRAIELDPLHAGLNSAAYWPFFCARQYDRALEQLMKAQAIDPHFPMQWVLLGRVYTAMKMYDDAIASFEKAAAANISIDITSSARAFVGHAYAASGRKQRALRIAREFERNRQQGDAAAAAVAMIYAELRDAASAVKWLERASAARNSMVRSLKADPAWDPIRSDPRFQDLILRMRLPS